MSGFSSKRLSAASDVGLLSCSKSGHQVREREYAKQTQENRDGKGQIGVVIQAVTRKARHFDPVLGSGQNERKR